MSESSAAVELQLAPSVPATVLAVASRTALAGLAVAGVIALTLPIWPSDGELTPATVLPLERVESVTARPSTDGMTMAELLSQVSRESRGVRASIIALEVAPEADAGADVHLRIDTLGADASSVAEVVGALDRAQLEVPRVRTVTPVPSGTRLDMTARVVRATTPLALAVAEGDGVGGTDLSVVLTGLVQRSGAELRRLEVREGSTAGEPLTVTLVARGAIAPLVVLLDALERSHTAPSRFVTLRVEAAGDDLYDLMTTFRLRDPVSSAGSTVAP